MRRAKPNLETLEDRLLLATVDYWWRPASSLLEQPWSTPSNWQDAQVSGHQMTTYPGSVTGQTDIVHIDNANYTDCVLDVQLLSTGISQLKITVALNLDLKNSLTVTNGGQLAGGGNIYSGLGGLGVSLSGGIFSWDSGNMGFKTAPSFNPGTLNVDGGTLVVDNTTSVILGYGINVGTGTAASTMQLANTGPIRDYGYDPSGGPNTTARQIVIGANGTLNITVDNTSGIVAFAPLTDVPAVFTSVGSVRKMEGTGGFYAIWEPWYQDGGTMKIHAGNALRFYRSTGADGGTTGNRGKSFFMDGGTLTLDDDPTLSSHPTLWLEKGYQQDYGSTLQCSSTNHASASTWIIDSRADNTNKIRLNGGITNIGSTDGDFGTLKLLTGGGTVGNTGVYWQAGTMNVNYHDQTRDGGGASLVSHVFTDAKVSITDTGSTGYKLSVLNLPLAVNTLVIIDTGGLYTVTGTYDPVMSGWTSTFNTAWTITRGIAGPRRR